MATKDITDIQVLIAFKNYQDDPFERKYAVDYLRHLTGESEKVCYAAMERCVKRGYIDYGVSLRTGWITPEGIELVKQELEKRTL